MAQLILLSVLVFMCCSAAPSLGLREDTGHTHTYPKEKTHTHTLNLLSHTAKQTHIDSDTHSFQTEGSIFDWG